MAKKAGTSNKVLSFEDIDKVQDIETVELDVPEWGGAVLIRTWSGTDAIRFQEAIQDDRNEGILQVVRNSVVNPDGSKVFEAKDRFKKLAGKSMKAIRRISDFALELNGVEPDAEKISSRVRAKAKGEKNDAVRARLLEIADEFKEGKGEGEG